MKQLAERNRHPLLEVVYFHMSINHYISTRSKNSLQKPGFDAMVCTNIRVTDNDPPEINAAELTEQVHVTSRSRHLFFVKRIVRLMNFKQTVIWSLRGDVPVTDKPLARKQNGL